MTLWIWAFTQPHPPARWQAGQAGFAIREVRFTLCLCFRFQFPHTLLKNMMGMLISYAREELFRFHIHDNVCFSVLINLYRLPIEYIPQYQSWKVGVLICIEDDIIFAVFHMHPLRRANLN